MKVNEQEYNLIYKECHACGKTHIPKNKINCTECKTNLKQSRTVALGINPGSTYEAPVRRESRDSRSQDYIMEFRVGRDGKHKSRQVEVTEPSNQVPKIPYRVCEPIFVNPASY